MRSALYRQQLELSRQLGLEPLPWKLTTNTYANHVANMRLYRNVHLKEAKALGRPPLPFGSPLEAIFEYSRVSRSRDIIKRMIPQFQELSQKRQQRVIRSLPANIRNEIKSQLTLVHSTPNRVEIPINPLWKTQVTRSIKEHKDKYPIVVLHYENQEGIFPGRTQFERTKGINIINKVIRFIQEQEQYYREHSHGELKKIIVQFVENRNRQVPPLAQGEMNCVIKAVLDQTHPRKRTKAIMDVPEYVDNKMIDDLEEFYNSAINIFDQMGTPWRVSTKQTPNKVFIIASDFHAKSVLDRKSYQCKINAIERNYEYTDGFYLPIHNVNKDMRVIKITNRKPKPFTNVWVTPKELEDKHIEYLVNGTNHHPIIAGSKILGIIEGKTNYKSKDYFLDYPVEDYTPEWSFAGLARNMLKNFLINTYGQNGEQLVQVSNMPVYKNIVQGQRPVHHIYHHSATGSIHQIDQTTAYTNACMGNLYDAQPYYRGYSTAPRNITTINKPLTPELMKQINTLHGYASFEYDQSHLSLKFFPDGTIQDKGYTTQPLQTVKFMYDKKIKIHINQLYTAAKTHEPFKGFQAYINKQKHSDSKAFKKIMNYVTGGLNKRTAKVETISTISKSELEHLIASFGDFHTIVSTRAIPYDKSKYEKVSDDLLDERIVIYYENKEAEPGFQMSHLSGQVLAYQKMVLYTQMEKLTNAGATILYVNTDSIAYELKDTMSPPSHFHYEVQDAEEFIAPRLNTKCFIKNNKIIHQSHGGSLVEYDISDFRNMKIKNYDNRYFSHPQAIADDYDVNDETTPAPGQELLNIQGEAGTGKSEIIKFLMNRDSKYTNEHKFKIVPTQACATTHTARKVIEAPWTIQYIMTCLAKCPHKLKIDTWDRLLIDECSMLGENTLTRLDRQLRTATKINRPFGGKSIYLFGDDKQLPSPNGLYFETKSYKYFTRVELTHNYRQDTDEKLLTILRKLRNYYKYGGDIKSTRQTLAVIDQILTKEERDLLNTRVAPHPTAPGTLTIHYSNKLVEESAKRIKKELTVGDKVIFRENLRSWNIYNGDVHTITNITCVGDKKYYAIDGHIFGQEKFITQEGQKHPAIQSVHSRTIHYSQGNTLESVWINNCPTLSINLLYVAMSRVRNIKDLQFNYYFP